MDPPYGSVPVNEAEFSRTHHLPEGPVTLEGDGFFYRIGPEGPKRPGTMEITCSAVSRPVVLRILTPKPSSVSGLGPESREGMEEGTWFYDEETGRAYAILGPDKEHKVRVILREQ